MKTPALESVFNNDASLKAFIERCMQYTCFSADIANILMTAFLKNISGGCFWVNYWNLVFLSQFTHQKSTENMTVFRCLTISDPYSSKFHSKFDWCHLIEYIKFPRQLPKNRWFMFLFRYCFGNWADNS